MSPRQSAAVYRRRRIVFFGGLIVVLVILIVLVWSIIARSWADGAQNAPAPTASSTSPAEKTPTPTTPAPTTPATTPAAGPTADPGATPPPADGSIAACAAKDVQVKAVTDAESYASDVQPQLSISLTNSGSTDCTLNVGTTTQAFTVSSGADVWWRSTDCQQNPSDMVVTLKAGSTVASSAPVAWDRTRSSVETCGAPDRPKAPGGGSTYHVAVSIGGFESAGTAQFILN
ncbi:cytoskeletal protein RodZ [Microbacterium resistens]|uniref:Cytoskeletal protein RodZ n=1 Tax=Microbacterium resistens TaxID=156977 RepID=A0ABU1SC43_9MICO|nr:hypothetical protein [Microbacterium resistens]MDR6867165.1 cytoskeletal protein RodZ [Microbacterium resistens]